MSTCRILVAGDLHLGRRSSRVESAVGVDASSRAAWGRLVDAAIEHSVRLLLLTGDVADGSNRFWEALGPLEQGIGRLAAAGIRTVAVSGNHDHEALPRLADRLDPADFRLLGRGGQWERWTLADGGRPLLHVDGWSFPAERVKHSPVEAYRPEPAGDVPVLGMVHGDLDVPTSPYAPLARAALLGQPVAGWLLGHIHAPLLEQAEGRPLIMYPGSPQALDPGEPGPHGAVLLEVAGGRVGSAERVPLSTVRYDEIAVDVSGVKEPGDLDGTLLSALEMHAASAAAEGGDPLAFLSVRVRLTGRTPLAGAIRAEAGRIEGDLQVRSAGVQVQVDRVVMDLRPAIDLAEQARASTPPGRLAKLLLELDAGTPTEACSEPTRTLLAETRRRIATVRGASVYQRVRTADGSVEPDDAEVRRIVRTQVEAMLVALVEGRG